MSAKPEIERFKAYLSSHGLTPLNSDEVTVLEIFICWQRNQPPDTGAKQ